MRLLLWDGMVWFAMLLGFQLFMALEACLSVLAGWLAVCLLWLAGYLAGWLSVCL